MKLLQIVPTIHEFPDFRAFGEVFRITERDLILTSIGLYRSCVWEADGHHTPTGWKNVARVMYRDHFGKGEPTDEMVNRMLKKRDEIHGSLPGGIDRIIAVGGGAILDMAKVLAVAPHGTQDVNDLYADPAKLHRQHELIAIPSTCGTGSEVTNISVIFRTPLGTKHGLVGDALYPAHAVLIPQTMNRLPYEVFAVSAIDALIHAVESYLSPLATSMTDMFGEKAIRQILTGFSLVVDDRERLHSQHGNFLQAALNAGVAFGNAGCGPVHALSFALGGKYHVPHGESCYQYFIPVLRYYQDSAAPGGKLEQLEALLCDVLHTEDGLSAMEGLLERILPHKPMAAYGAVEADVPAFAHSTIDNQQRLLARAYVPVDYEAALAIEAECLK